MKTAPSYASTSRRLTLLVLLAPLAVCGACGGATAEGPRAVEAGGPDSGGALAADGAPSGDAASDGAARPFPPYFGANVEPGGVVFRVWAPAVTAAHVSGEVAPNDVAMVRLGNGVFEAHVPAAHAGQSYSFVFDEPTPLTRLDPYCRQVRGALCVVVDPGAFAWHDAAFKRPNRESTVVYELHVASFAVPPGASSGTFAAVAAALPRLADLGVNAIELMPPFDFGGSADGWGYNPQLYFAPHPELGTADELRTLVDCAHGLGIAVWSDAVVNHYDGSKQAPLSCFDGPCPNASSGVYFFPPGPYASTPWGPRLDYTKPEVSSMVVDSATAWMTELHGDGFRWDSTSNIRANDGQGTMPGGQELLVRLNDRIHTLGGLSIAEDLKGYAPMTQSTSSGGLGFDAQWDGFGYDVDDVIAPMSDPGRDVGRIASAVQGTYGGDGFARLLFTETHDTVGNGGSRLPDRIDTQNPTSWAARKRSMLAAVLMLTSPGVPMLFMGQELLATGSFPSRPAPLPASTALGEQVRAFYKDMIRLRRNVDGGAGGLSDAHVEVVQQNDAAKVLAYRRFGASGQDVVVVVNMMNKAYAAYDIGVADAGPWRIRLNTDSTKYSADFSQGQSGAIAARPEQKDGKPYALALQLGAYSAMVLTH